MTELQKQFEQETGTAFPALRILVAGYWKAYAKWLEPKAQPKAKPATPPPSDDTKAVIDSHYFQDGRGSFERRIAFTAFDNFASVKVSTDFALLSPRGRLIAILYYASKDKITDKRFEYWAEVKGSIRTNVYASDPYFDIELQSDGGGYYRETIVGFKNTEAKLEHTT